MYMMSEINEMKVKVAIKALLCARSPKRFTSSEICDFINNNNFGLGKLNVTQVQITRWIKSSTKNVLSDVKMERKSPRNVWEFWI